MIYDKHHIDQLHDAAMSKAQEAMLARFRGNGSDECERLNRESFDLEKQAAMLLKDAFEYEPTRSVYFRSAATLALNLRDYREAERLVSFGLSGNPPDEVAAELREVYENANFHRHLELHGEELDDTQFQLTVSGNAVGHGFVDESVWSSRVDALGKMLHRIIQRKNQCAFDDSKLARLYRISYGIPRAASYAVSFQLIAPLRTLFSDYVPSKEIIVEMFDCLDLFEKNGEEAVKEHIVDDVYADNFVALAKTMAPDGNLVKQVGVVNPIIRSTPVALYKTRKEQRSPRKKRETTQDKIHGKLVFADRTHQGERNKIQIRDAADVLHIIFVGEEFIDDIVRPLWNEQVSILVKNHGGRLTLMDIYPEKEENE